MQVFRTLLFHFGTDNFLPIVGKAPKYGMAHFVRSLLSRPNLDNDEIEA